MTTRGIKLPRAPRVTFPHLRSGDVSLETREREQRRDVPFVRWDDFLAFHFDWQQGEHVTLVGPTGTGKTTAALEILPMRDYVVAIATKQRDPVLYKLEDQGYLPQDDFSTPAEVHPRIVLTAHLAHGAESIGEQRQVVKEALLAVYKQGGWCVYLDELRYITDYLKLGRDVELLWQQGRSAGISVVGGTQRPAFVPLAAYDQATHIFLWRDNDRRNLERLGGLGAHDPQQIAREVARLPQFTILYLNTRTGERLTTKVDI